MAILLGSGIKGKSSLEIAKSVLKKYPKSKFLKLSFKELSKINGIGKAKARLLLASFELFKRIIKVKDQVALVIKTVDGVAAQVIYMKDKRREHFMVLYLNARNELIFKH